MVSLPRTAAVSAAAFSLGLLGAGQAGAATASCASIAADPASINQFKDMKGFKELVGALAAQCPEVLVGLDVPLESIIDLPPPKVTASDSGGNGRIEAPASDPYAAKIAALTEANERLTAAVTGVQKAEERVRTAMGQVAQLSQVSALQRTLKGWSLSDLAEKRETALSELEAARRTLETRQTELAAAIKDAATQTAAAQTTLDAATMAVNAKLGGGDYGKVLAQLKADAEAAKNAADGLAFKAGEVLKASNDITNKISSSQITLNLAKADLASFKEQREMALKALTDAKITCNSGGPCDKPYLAQLDAMIVQLDLQMAGADKLIGGVGKEISEMEAKKASLDAEFQKLDALRVDAEAKASTSGAAVTALDTLGRARDTAQAALELVKTTTGAAVTKADDAVDAAAVTVEEKEKAARDLIELTEEEAAQIAEAEAAAKDLEGAMAAMTDAQDDARNALNDVSKSDPDRVTNAAEDLSATLDDSITSGEAASEAAESVTGTVDRIGTSLDNLTDAVAGDS